jgi:hypothetical protein
MTSSSSDSSLEKVDLQGAKDMEMHRDSKVATSGVEMAEKTVSRDDLESASLPPVDRGHQAWLFLAGCYVMEFLVFGTELSSTHFQALETDA